MLAILVAFGAAAFIWFHNDSTAPTIDSVCYIPETVTETVEPATTDFVEQVFENNELRSRRLLRQ